MKRSIAITLATATGAVLTACGSGGNEGGAAVVPGEAEAQIERAARVELVAEAVPAEARDQGLRASYSNRATAVKDKQIVGLFVVEDADVADEVSGMVRRSAPRSAKLMVEGNVMVVYATAGADHTDAVERAVKAL